MKQIENIDAVFVIFCKSKDVLKCYLFPKTVSVKEVVPITKSCLKIISVFGLFQQSIQPNPVYERKKRIFPWRSDGKRLTMGRGEHYLGTKIRKERH